MDKWEYETILISYERKPYKDWVIKPAEQAPIVGLQSILKSYGTQGWELVSLYPERSAAYPEFGKWGIEPTVYRATFKRLIRNTL